MITEVRKRAQAYVRNVSKGTDLNKLLEDYSVLGDFLGRVPEADRGTAAQILFSLSRGDDSMAVKSIKESGMKPASRLSRDRRALNYHFTGVDKASLEEGQPFDTLIGDVKADVVKALIIYIQKRGHDIEPFSEAPITRQALELRFVELHDAIAKVNELNAVRTLQLRVLLNATLDPKAADTAIVGDVYGLGIFDKGSMSFADSEHLKEAFEPVATKHQNHCPKDAEKAGLTFLRDSVVQESSVDDGDTASRDSRASLVSTRSAESGISDVSEQSELEALRAQVATLQQENKELNTLYHSNTEKLIADHDALMEEARAENGDLERQLKEAIAEVAKLEKTQLENPNPGQAVDREVLQGTVPVAAPKEGVDARITALESTLASKHAVIAALKTAYEALKHRYAVIEEAMTELTKAKREELVDTEVHVAAPKEGVDARITALESTLASKHEAIDALETANEAWQHRYAAIEEAMTQLMEAKREELVDTEVHALLEGRNDQILRAMTELAEAQSVAGSAKSDHFYECFQTEKRINDELKQQLSVLEGYLFDVNGEIKSPDTQELLRKLNTVVAINEEGKRENAMLKDILSRDLKKNELIHALADAKYWKGESKEAREEIEDYEKRLAATNEQLEQALDRPKVAPMPSPRARQWVETTSGPAKPGVTSKPPVPNKPKLAVKTTLAALTEEALPEQVSEVKRRPKKEGVTSSGSRRMSKEMQDRIAMFEKPGADEEARPLARNRGRRATIINGQGLNGPTPAIEAQPPGSDSLVTVVS